MGLDDRDLDDKRGEMRPCSGWGLWGCVVINGYFFIDRAGEMGILAC